MQFSAGEPSLQPRPARHGRERWSRARIITLTCIGAGALVLIVGAAWLVVTALLARGQLNAVRHDLPQLRRALSAGDFDRAGSLAQGLEVHAHRAHALTSGPAWAVAASLPWAGQPAETGRIVATQSDRLGTTVLPGVLELAHELSADAPRHGAQVDLGRIASAVPVLDHAADAAAAAAVAVAHAPHQTWLGSADTARSKVLNELSPVADQLAGAARSVHILLPMLGQSGVQRYFVGFENEAEARGLGGLPGAFAIVTADHGMLEFTHFENDDTLRHVGVDLDLGRDFEQRYHDAAPTTNYGDSDVSPHFPFAAQIWAAMWQKKSGEHIDGAIAIDPTALGYLLKVTGAATLPGGTRVSAGNVVALTEKDQYAMFTDDASRKKYLVDLAEGVSNSLLGRGSGDTKALVRAAAHAAREHRLVMWTADPKTEAGLVRAGYAGVVEADGDPFTGFVVSSAGSGKLDYYLDRSMSYQRTGCGAGSTSTATFRMTNTAPATGLPPYVTIRLDQTPPGYQPGDNRLLVTYYASAGAKIKSVTVDGKHVAVRTIAENGLVTVTADVEIPAGKSRTMRVKVTEPPATRPAQVYEQPLVMPMAVHVTGARCGS